MLSLHQMLESPNIGSNNYKKGVCEVEGSRDNEKKKKLLPAVSGGKKEKLASITFESKVGKLNLRREQGSRSR